MADRPQVSVRIEENIKLKLDALCMATNKSQSEFISELIVNRVNNAKSVIAFTINESDILKFNAYCVENTIDKNSVLTNWINNIK